MQRVCSRLASRRYMCYYLPVICLALVSLCPNMSVVAWDLDVYTERRPGHREHDIDGCHVGGIHLRLPGLEFAI